MQIPGSALRATAKGRLQWLSSAAAFVLRHLIRMISDGNDPDLHLFCSKLDFFEKWYSFFRISL
jgi:hypothetical protein